MSEAGKQDGAGEPGTPDLKLRPAAPTRRSQVSELQASDPTQIDEYRLLGQLGLGGMGTVYLGQSQDGSRVAIKLVHAHLARDPRFRTRFAGEVRAAQRVPGFCTARVLDSGVFEDRPYLVTEYLDGIPLSRLVAEDGPLDPATLHSVALGVAAALAAVHAADLVHRDLKPSNLIVTLGGVRIIDFGIARALDAVSDITGTGNIVGSLGWASPEQLRAEEPRPAMDVFGWGCLVAFAATGRHPFGGEEAAARAWKILEGTADLTGVPESVRPLLEAALDRDPEKRPTAQQLLLGLAVNSLHVTPPEPPLRRLTRGVHRSRLRATAMAAAVPMALALVFALAETTAGLMSGGTANNAGRVGAPDASAGTAVVKIVSARPEPPTPGPEVPGQPGQPNRRERPGATPAPTKVPTIQPTIGPGGTTPAPTTPAPSTSTPSPDPTTPSPDPTTPTPQPTVDVTTGPAGEDPDTGLAFP